MTARFRQIMALLGRVHVPPIVQYGAVATLIGALQNVSAGPLAGDGDVAAYFIVAWAVLWALMVRCRPVTYGQAFLDASVALILIAIGLCVALALQHRDSPAARGAVDWLVANWIVCTFIVHAARLWFGRRAR